MKFLKFFLILFFANNVYAEIFIYSCLNTDNFQQIFEIDTEKKIVIHKTSYNFKNDDKYNVNEIKNVLFF